MLIGKSVEWVPGRPWLCTSRAESIRAAGSIHRNFSQLGIFFPQPLRGKKNYVGMIPSTCSKSGVEWFAALDCPARGNSVLKNLRGRRCDVECPSWLDTSSAQFRLVCTDPLSAIAHVQSVFRKHFFFSIQFLVLLRGVFFSNFFCFACFVVCSHQLANIWCKWALSLKIPPSWWIV